MNVAYADACITCEVLQSKATVSPSAGASYTLAAAAVRVKYIQLTVGSTTWPVMEERTLEEILQFRAQATSAPTTGPPIYYAFDGTATIEVYPNFQGTESMDVWAVNQPTALSGASDVPAIPEPYASVILYGALVELSDFSKDMLTGTQGYAQMYQYWLGKLRTHLNRRRGAQTKQFVVRGSRLFTPADRSVDTRSW